MSFGESYHSSETTPAFLSADGETSLSLLPVLVPSLKGDTVYSKIPTSVQLGC